LFCSLYVNAVYKGVFNHCERSREAFFQALVQYNMGQPLNLSAFNSWTAPGSGRRSYLLGSVPGRQMLRNAGLWPLTEPPVSSQYGSSVPPAMPSA